MKKVSWFLRSFLFSALILCSSSLHAQSSYDRVITAGNEELHFVSRPELGYVVLSQEQIGAVNALDGTLRQLGAQDIRPVRGQGRQGVSVVFSRRPASDNENTIKTLKARSHIKYAAPLFSSNEETVAVIPEIVVRLKENTDDEQLQDLCQSINLTIKHKLQFTEREYLIEVQTADADGVFIAVEQLNQAAFIEWAFPNVAFRPQLLGQVIPNDTYFPNQWHLNNTGQSGGTPNADINAPEAWEITTGDPDIVVAVLDEGVDTDHPDLIDNIVAGYDFYDDDSNPNPTGDDAHGTACAGLIAASGNNTIGVTGVAWSCKIMPVRIAGGSGFITEAEIAEAIRWAANNNADVMSNSWGSTSALPVIRSAIQDVTKQDGIGRDGKGCVVLFASGNNSSSVIYPARYAEVIAVGATDKYDDRWSYSCYGPELDIVAPSGRAGDPPVGDIWTTDIAGSAGYNNRSPSILDYTDKMGGTSGACPVAAGVAALVLSFEPNLTNTDVQNILQNSTVDLGSPGRDNYYGFGRIDAYSAMTMAQKWPRQQWVAYYDGPGNTTDMAKDLVVDGLGNVYVTGNSYSASANYDYATIKYDPDGSQLWLARYNSPFNDSDYPSDLAIDGLGNVYVTGEIQGTSGMYDNYATIKYNSDGNQLWVAQYNGPGNGRDSASALEVDSLGNVYVTGNSYGSGPGNDYATIKYDSNGSQLWVARYNDPNNNADDGASALAVDGLGNVYVTGSSYGSGASYDYVTIKYDSNGSQLWAARYNGPGNSEDRASALVIDGLGNVCITGRNSGSGTDYDYATIKYGSDGNQLWVRRYNGPGNDEDIPYALAVDDLGNVYVTGESYGSGTGDDYATIKYNSDGNEMWVARYNDPRNSSDCAQALAVDNSGGVYVTGYSWNINQDCATVKYDSNGSQLWVKHYNGPGNSFENPNALTVDDFGNVYVTGYTNSNSTNEDYATIKYSQRNYCTAVLDGDLDGNCKVDVDDLALFAVQWLDPMDFTDYATLADNWLECELAYQGACW